MAKGKFPNVPIYEVESLEKLLDGPLEIDWLVEDLIPPGTATILAGESGIGKTWLLLDLILSVASGEKWLDRFNVKPGSVLVIDEENANLLLRIRLNKLIKAKGYKFDVADLPIFFVVGQMAHLSPEKDKYGNITPSEPFKRIYNTIESLNPTLTTFDSLTRVHRNNESLAGDMALVFSQVKMLMDELKTACLFTHHFTKVGKNGDGNRIRGSGDIRAFADTTILVESGKDCIVVTHDKSRWSKPIDQFGINIIEENDSISIQIDKAAKLPKREYKDIWTWLEEYVAFHGRTSRVKLIDVAEGADICKTRTLDSVLNWRSERNYLVKEKEGKEVFFTLGEKSELAKINANGDMSKEEFQLNKFLAEQSSFV